ncbi:MAG: DUF1648 domain-containing protein [Rariglobus sp.]
MSRSRLSLYTWLATTALFVACVTTSSLSLPERVATHFDAAGDANGWMSRTSAIVTVIGLGFGISAFLIGLAYSIRFFPPSTLNVPHQAYWRAPENYPRACRYFFLHTFWLAALNNLFLGGVHQSIVAANADAPPALLIRYISVGTGLFVTGVLVWTFFLIRFFLKAPRT